MYNDVRDTLCNLPHIRNTTTGEDCRKADWFQAPACYPRYAEMAEGLKPRSILEIGTLLGFGLVSFLSGHPEVEEIVGVDNESYIRDSRRLCDENIASVFPHVRRRFVRTLEEARGSYDLIHVDGDHTFNGALHDMAFAWGLGPRYMLVDDFDAIPEVQQAVYTFSKHQGMRFAALPSFRGWAAFRRRGL